MSDPVTFCICADPENCTERVPGYGCKKDFMPRASAPLAKEWRCFHCDDVFTSEVDARAHFGSGEASEPACRIKAAGEFALLQALRNAEDELGRYRNEDSDVLRAMWSAQADHATALRREEEKGYARGLRDAAREDEAARKERLGERWS